MKVCYVEVSYKSKQNSTVFRVPITEDPDDPRPNYLTYDQILNGVAASYEEIQPSLYLPHHAPAEADAADVFIKSSEISYVMVTPIREENPDDIKRTTEQN